MHFVTPTELKGGEKPEFGILLARIRDRIGTLRELYGDGPLTIDFKAFGERASCVTMTRCDLVPVIAERTSRATGQRHSLGGNTGVAEYEGQVQWSGELGYGVRPPEGGQSGKRDDAATGNISVRAASRNKIPIRLGGKVR